VREGGEAALSLSVEARTRIRARPDAAPSAATETEAMHVGIGFGPVIPDLDHVGQKQALEVVEQAAAQARDAGIETETTVRRGVPAEEICAIAEAEDAQLIVLGSHGWGPMRRMICGSVSTSVLHQSRRPVLVVPWSSNGEHIEHDDVVEQVEA
jgi:nucleotide-binding universal stress UspA family protein